METTNQLIMKQTTLEGVFRAIDTDDVRRLNTTLTDAFGRLQQQAQRYMEQSTPEQFMLSQQPVLQLDNINIRAAEGRRLAASMAACAHYISFYSNEEVYTSTLKTTDLKAMLDIFISTLEYQEYVKMESGRGILLLKADPVCMVEGTCNEEHHFWANLQVLQDFNQTWMCIREFISKAMIAALSIKLADHPAAINRCKELMVLYAYAIELAETLQESVDNIADVLATLIVE